MVACIKNPKKNSTFGRAADRTQGLCAQLTMTRCCMDGSGTGIRRALPMAGWGTSPSPPISLEVSTMTTRLWSSSASVRAISRMTVVLPTPGLPRNRMLLATASTSTPHQTKGDLHENQLCSMQNHFKVDLAVKTNVTGACWSAPGLLWSCACSNGARRIHFEAAQSWALQTWREADGWL